MPDLQNLQPGVRNALGLFMQEYGLEPISGFRDPFRNAQAGGSTYSQHLDGNALDFSVKGLSDADKTRVVNWWRAKGATGIGYYPGSDSIHVDFRQGPAVAWGPDRSHTSLGETPPWFQSIAAEHRGGKPLTVQEVTAPGVQTDLAGAGISPLPFAEVKAQAMPDKKVAPDPFAAWGIDIKNEPPSAKQTARPDPFKAWGIDTGAPEPAAGPTGATKTALPQGEWWQGQSDPSIVGTAARTGIGVVRGAKDVFDTLAHGVAQGTSGAADFLASKGLLPQSAADTVRSSAENAIATDRAGLQQFKNEYGNSTAATVGRVGGNVAATAPLMSLGASAAGLTNAPIVGNRILDLMFKSGVAGGTANALTASATDTPFPQHVGEGAVIGAALGPVAPVIAKGLSAAGNKIMDVAAGYMPQRAATNALAGAVSDSGVPMSDIAARLQSNPRLSLMDVDPNLQMRAMGIASQPGSGRAVLDQALRARTSGAPGAVQDAYDAALGGVKDPIALVEGLKQTAATNAAKGFGEALTGAKPVNVAPVIEAIDSKLYPGVTGVASKASDIPMSAAQQELARVKALITDGESVLTDPNRLHEIQAQLRRTADTLSKSANAQDHLVAGEIRDVRSKLVNQIDEATGGKFKPAQAQYADDKAVEEAFYKGLDVFKNRGGAAGIEDRPEAWRAALKDMSAPEREAVQQGVRVAVDQQVNSVRNAARKGADLPEVGFNRAKLEAILGKDETSRLAKTLQDEQAIAATNSRLFQNSQTAPRQEAVKATAVRPVSGLGWDVGLPIAGGLGINAETGVALTLAALARRGVQAAGQRADVARNELMARALSATGPERDAAVNMLMRAAGRPADAFKIPQRLIPVAGANAADAIYGR